MSNEELLFTIGAKDTASTVIKKVGQELRHLDQYQKEVSKSGKEYQNSTEGLKQKLEILTRQYQTAKTGLDAYTKKMQEVQDKIDKQKQKIEALKNAEGDHSKEIETATKTLDKYQTQMHNLENSYETLSQKAKNFSTEIGNTSNKLNNKALEDYKEHIRSIGDNLTDTGDKITRVGNAMGDAGTKIAAISGAVLGASYKIAEMAMNYETSLAKLQSIAQYTPSELSSVSDEIIKISNDTGQSVTDIAESAYQAISAGVDKSKVTDFVEQMNELSKAGFTSLGSSVDVVTTVLNAYGLSVDEAINVSDLLMQTQNAGKLTVDEMASSLGAVIPTAAAYGVNLEQLCTYLAESTASGVSCSESITYANSCFNELGDSGSKVGTILRDKTGKTFKELMESGNNLSDIMLILNQSAQEQGIQFTELWGSAEAGKAGLSVLSDEGKKFNDVLGQMKNSAGATKKAFDTVSDTSKERLNKSINELKNSFLKMGESLTPLIDALSQGISKVADAFSKLDPEVAANIVKFATLTAGIGVTLKVVGTFTSGIGNLVSGIGSGVKALGNLIKVNETTSAALSTTRAATKGLTTGTVAAAGGFGTLGKALSLLTSPAGLAVGAVAGVAAAIYSNQKALDNNEKKLADMGHAYDDFSGKLRSNESIWTEIFGREYSWKFSNEYKQALENSAAEVEEWATHLQEIQNQINGILNDTSKTDEVKEKEMNKVLGTTHYDITQATPSESDAFWNYLQNDITLTKEGQQDAMRNYSAFISDMKEKINKNTEEITAIYEKANEQRRELTQAEMNKIEELQKDSGAMQVQIENQNGSDILSAMNEWLSDKERIQEKYGDDELTAVRELLDKKKTANEEELESTREKIESQKWLSESEKAHELENAEAIYLSKKSQIEFSKACLEQQALYDEEYRSQHKLHTESLIVDNERVGNSVIDEQGIIQGMFFDTEEDLKNYAEQWGYTTEEIKGQNGEMTTVILNADNEIIGSVNSVIDKYNMFANDINNSLSEYVDGVNTGKITTDEAMRKIAGDLDTGKIHAESFGMSKSQFLAVAEAMLTSKGDADKLTEAINNIPSGKYINISADSSQADGVISSINRRLDDLNGRTITTYISTVTNGNQMAGGYIKTDEYASGGYIDNGEIAWTNENHRFELTDKPAYEIGVTSFGSLTALSAGTRVYNNTASVDMMKSAVQEEVARAVSEVSLGGYYDRSAAPAIKLNNTLNPVISQSSFDLAPLLKAIQQQTALLTAINNKSADVYLDKQKVGKGLAPVIDKELGKLR